MTQKLYYEPKKIILWKRWAKIVSQWHQSAEKLKSQLYPISDLVTHYGSLGDWCHIGESWYICICLKMLFSPVVTKPFQIRLPDFMPSKGPSVQNSKKNKWQDIILITCVDSLTHKSLWWPSTPGDSLVPDPDNTTRNLSMASFSTMAFLLALLKSRLLLQGSRRRQEEYSY